MGNLDYYILMRRETGHYILGADETSSVAEADRYYSRSLAERAMGPNTCVCGPYSTADFP